ncbi:MAG: RadC family protein [Thermodesulfobacteriota bacterium]
MAVKKSYHGHRKRLRDKFTSASLDGFHDYEIVELLLTYPIPRADVKPRAKALIKRFGGIGGVLGAGADELSSIKGIGEKSAIFLTLLREVAYAYLRDKKGGGRSINNAEDAVDFLGRNFSDPGGDRFMALYLDTKNYVLDAEVLHEGVLNPFDVSAKGVVENALSRNARSIIFVHNTAGLRAGQGSTDKRMAVELQNKLSAIDIIVHDYLVIGGDYLLSARAEGWFEKG